MMEVVWVETALNQLATLWTQAGSGLRQEITSAVHAVDQLLQNDPDQVGESREGNERVTFVDPLGVRFEVDAEHSVVRVLNVWVMRRRK